MKRDTVIGIAGTLILVTGMVGIFQFEASRATGSAFDVEWVTTTVAGPGAEGEAEEGTPDEKGLRIARPNVTRAEFSLTWTDDVGAPDRFNLTVTSPTGETRSAEADDGNVTLVFDGLAAVPAGFRTTADSEEALVERTASDTTSTAAQGEWRLTVTLVDAPGLTPAGDLEVQPDGANAWTLVTSLSVYEAEVTPAT